MTNKFVDAGLLYDALAKDCQRVFMSTWLTILHGAYCNARDLGLHGRIGSNTPNGTMCLCPYEMPNGVMRQNRKFLELNRCPGSGSAALGVRQAIMLPRTSAKKCGPSPHQKRAGAC